jgi:hypothetical protein
MILLLQHLLQIKIKTSILQHKCNHSIVIIKVFWYQIGCQCLLVFPGLNLRFSLWINKFTNYILRQNISKAFFQTSNRKIVRGRSCWFYDT